MKKYFYLIFTFYFIFHFQGCKEYPEIKNGNFYKKTITTERIKNSSVNFVYSVPKNYINVKSYPLIVVLHGHGSNCMAFGNIWKPSTDSLDVVLLSVQGEKNVFENQGFGWGVNAESDILSSIDYIKNIVNIDKDNIYLAGFSSGGSLAYYLGLKYPIQFSGIAVFSSPFRKEYLNKTLINQKNKIFIGHGALEKGYAEDSQLAKKLFEERQVNVMYRSYPGIKHNLPKPWKKYIDELINFLIN